MKGFTTHIYIYEKIIRLHMMISPKFFYWMILFFFLIIGFLIQDLIIFLDELDLGFNFIICFSLLFINRLCDKKEQQVANHKNNTGY